ncbi:MAG: GDP-mannose 4,6-dehydratase [Candidatus Thiodiazotropha sp.]
MTTALITGISGQDGSYMAELLLSKGFNVIGTVKDSDDKGLPEHLVAKVTLVEMDLSDSNKIDNIIRSYPISQIYNFAAFSSGEGMFDYPEQIGDINGLAVTRILQSIHRTNPRIRFCQASSSEMFGYPRETPQNESSFFHPRTPYGSAKLYAHNMIDIYRRQYGLFACSSILYNHESPRRGINFVTRKVVRAAAAIKLNMQKNLELGTLDAKRDWGYAKDYVNAMFLMLSQKHPDDYVIATGVTHSIKELCQIAFGYLDLDYTKYVQVTNTGSRAPDSLQLAGDASKARANLGWEPTIDFKQMIHLMVDHELEDLTS